MQDRRTGCRIGGPRTGCKRGEWRRFGCRIGCKKDGGGELVAELGVYAGETYAEDHRDRELAAPVQVQAVDDGPFTFVFNQNRSSDAVCNTVGHCINSSRYISELVNELIT